MEYTGTAADGWLGTSFTPEHAAAHLDYLRRGAESAGRSLADIDIQVGGTVAFGDDLDALVEPKSVLFRDPSRTTQKTQKPR